MRDFTVREIADITGGILLSGDESTVITNIQYDSRQVGKGTLFVPIKGANTDPHRFIGDCFDKGAAAALTEQDTSMGPGRPCIKVSDTRLALQQIAAFYRSSMDLHLVGVTGSVGKTSTKEMIAAALSDGLDVMKTQGNRNSQIGLPMTMFEIEPHHQAAVIEMGMSEFGEMDRLCDVARPDIAVMTNIGTAHIENLHTRENIMSEKFRITKHFDSTGVLILNGDDPLLSTLKGKCPFRTLSFGMDPDNDYYAEDVRTEGFSTRFVCCSKDGRRELCIPALGVHSIMNALAAYAVGKVLGLDDESISRGLLNYRNAPMRQQIIGCGGMTIIDDSYNASPEAAKASLKVLAEVSKGRSIAVLADMLELGDAAADEHYGVGKKLAELGIDILIAVGPLSRSTAKGASENGCASVFCADTNPEALEKLLELLRPGDTLLVKGSRGMHTDEIVKGLCEKFK